MDETGAAAVPLSNDSLSATAVDQQRFCRDPDPIGSGSGSDQDHLVKFFFSTVVLLSAALAGVPDQP